MPQNIKNIPPPPDWNEVSSKKGLPPPPPDWGSGSSVKSATSVLEEKPFEFKFGEPTEVKTPKAIITYNNTVSSQEPKRSVDYIKANARQTVLTDPGMKIPENRDYYYNTFKAYGLKDKDIDKLKSYSEDQFVKGQRNEELKAAINKNPNDRDNNYLLGLNQIELDQPEEAIKSFMRGLGSPKSTKEVPIAGQTQKLGVASNDDNLLYSIGYAYSKIGDKASAEDYYKQALKANPDNYSALQAMGGIAYLNGNKEEARRLFDMGAESENKEMTSQYTRYAIGESPEEIKASQYATNISKAVNALVLGTSTGDQEFDKIVGAISPTAFVSKYFQGAKEGFKSAIDKTIGDKHREVLEKEGGLAAGTVFLSGLVDGAFASAKLLPGVAPTLAGFELGGAVLPSQLTEAVMAPASSMFGGMSDSEMKKAVLEIGDVIASIALIKGAEHGISKGLSKKLNKNEPLNQEEAGQVIKLMQEATPEEVERATFLSRRDEINSNINKLKDDLSKADDVGDKHDIIEEINKLQQESTKLDVESKKREIAPLISAASFEVDRLKKSLDYIEKNPWSDASVQKSTVESLTKKIAAKEEEMQSIISKSFEAKEVPEAAEPVIEQEVAQQKETSGEQVAAVPEIEPVKPAAEVSVNPPSAEPGAKAIELPEEQRQFNDFVAKKMPDKNFNAHYVRDSERADALAEHLDAKPSKKIPGELELNEEYKQGGERRGHETEKYGVTYDVNVGGKVFKMSSRDFTEGYKERNLAGEKVNVELLKPTDEDLSKVHGKFKIVDNEFTFPESPTPNAKYPYILQVRNAKTREFIGNLRISDFGGGARKMRAPGAKLERLTAAKKVFKVKEKGNEYEFNKDVFGDIAVKVNDVPMKGKDADRIIKNVYEKKFDYSEGRRAEDSGMPLTADADEVFRYIANHSENPMEIIEAYKQASGEIAEANPKMKAIYESLPKGNDISMDSYLKGAGDKNKISSYMLNKYLSKDGNIKIDNIVEMANEKLGIEEGSEGAISHEDVVSFLETVKKSEYEKELKSNVTPSMKRLAGAFRTLTGFDLNEGIINKALKQQESIAKAEFKEVADAAYIKSPERSQNIKEKFQPFADKFRQAKIPKGNTMITVPFAPEVWNLAMETIATTIEATGNVAHAVSKGLEYLKSTDWYKGLSSADKKDAINAVKSGELPKVTPRTNLEKAKDVAQQTIGAIGKVKTSYDLSAFLRQGLLLSIRNPRAAARAFSEMHKQGFSEKKYQKWHDDYMENPYRDVMEGSGLHITDINKDIKLTDREEGFQTTLLNKVPGMKLSERAFTAYLNQLRVNTFMDYAAMLEKKGITYSKNPKEFKDFAKIVNSASGRGSLGSLEKHIDLLTSVYWSPRLIASRMNFLNPKFYSNLSPEARKEAAKMFLQFAGTVGTVAAMANMSGLNVGTDPRSSDFLKAKVGRIRYDLTGGFQQYVKIATQIAAGKYVDKNGKVHSIDPLRVIVKGSEYKFNPIVSLALELKRGENAIGEKTTPIQSLERVFIPLQFQSLNELIQDGNKKSTPGAKAAAGIYSLYGGGVQDY